MKNQALFSSKDKTKSLKCLLLQFVFVGRLVGCFGLNGSLRQYFCLYRSPREKEKDERNDRQEKKCPNNPHPLQVQQALSLL